MTADGKRPAFLFYPGDWLRDPAVRSLSMEARGLWIDLLCLMFECDRKGYLMINGKPPTEQQVARMTGCPPDSASRLVRELEDSGVCSRTEEGVLFSRRMARDEHIRNVRSVAGKMGAPYGKLGGRPRKRQTTAKETASPTGEGFAKGLQPKGQNNPPSVSVSSSLEETPLPPSPKGKVKEHPERVPIPESLDTQPFREAWAMWLAYRAKKKEMTELSAELQLKRLAKIGEARAIAAVEFSIANSWEGVFEEKGRHRPDANGRTARDMFADIGEGDE